MKKNLSITAALLMASVACGVANAENFKPMTFAQHDANGDGVLSKEEVRGRLFANFTAFDSDGSGTLSAQEFAAVKMGGQGKHPKFPAFADLDGNGDGLLSEDEFAALKAHRKAHNRPTFQELDKNSDGVLAKEEVGRGLLARFGEVDTDASGTLSAAEFAAIKMDRHDGKGRHHNRQSFAMMDKNSDGMLVKEEIGGRLLADFEELDRDANGSLSEDELALPGGCGAPQ